MSPSRLPFGMPPATDLRSHFDAALNVDLDQPHKLEVSIPMRDGVELAATVFLPAASERPAPAILEGTPYDKEPLSNVDDPVLAETRHIDNGYAIVNYDTRGRGKSEGEWQAFSMYDAWDGHDVVEWVAAQDWCTGAVGQEGLSYDGWTTMATVSQNPPHLKAAIPFSPAGRWQQEIPYTYGCCQLFFVWWYVYVRRRISEGLGSTPELLEMLPIEAAGEKIKPAGTGWREYMDHEGLDELWRSRRWDGEYTFDTPLLHVTGWHDREDIHGAFHHYEQMMAHSPARENQWLLVGPWSHVSTLWPTDEHKGVHYPDAALDMPAIKLRFFDHFLKGEDNGVDTEPRVRLYDPGAKEWTVREAWKGGTKPFDLYLAGDGKLAAEAGEDGEDGYAYDPAKPNGMKLKLDTLPLEPNLDLAELEAQDGVIGWTGEPLAEDVIVRGWGELELWAATDREDTEWYVKVADVDPDGKALWVGWGCLRASFADDLETPTAVTPNEPRLYSIELTPTFHTFKAGHRFRVLLSSSEYPWYARNMNRFEPIKGQKDPLVATNTAFHGSARPSRLRLEVEE
ncbi:MAG: CocE/NonD family hydrolase [Actinobacteria bacterium]|nr:CocE/NonD family hydrolase [Actinomycetota bacterium]